MKIVQGKIILRPHVEFYLQFRDFNLVLKEQFPAWYDLPARKYINTPYMTNKLQVKRLQHCVD